MEPSPSVGTELLFENEVVRVWSMELAPGQQSPYHEHTLDYVYAYVTPSKLAYLGSPGVWSTCESTATATSGSPPWVPGSGTR